MRPRRRPTGFDMVTAAVVTWLVTWLVTLRVRETAFEPLQQELDP